MEYNKSPVIELQCTYLVSFGAAAFECISSAVGQNDKAPVSRGFDFVLFSSFFTWAQVGLDHRPSDYEKAVLNFGRRNPLILA